MRVRIIEMKGTILDVKYHSLIGYVRVYLCSLCSTLHITSQ